MKFVLVVGDSDESNPDKLSGLQTQLILGSPLIVHWYANNCGDTGCESVYLPSARYQWSGAREKLQVAAEQKIGLIDGMALNTRQEKKTNVFVAFTVYTGIRTEVWNSCCGVNGSYASFSSCARSPVQGVDYFKSIAESKWVISPPGAGLDTYRTWEALYMSSFAIVQSHPAMNSLYSDLPVLIVGNLARDLNTTFLAAKYELFRARSDWKFERLYVSFWRKLFEEKFRA